MFKTIFKDQISDLWQWSTFSDNTPHYAMSPVHRLLSNVYLLPRKCILSSAQYTKDHRY